jgi:pyruvate kinase
VEIPIETIAAVQKQLLEKANRLAKPAITATQMLLSMVENRRPTRAEVTDVANAILNGSDCVMLSEESAVGAYPVEAVHMLSRIAKVTEPQLLARLEPEPAPSDEAAATPALVAASVADMAARVRPAGILVPSRSGTMARRLARYRLPAWITAVSGAEATCQALQFVFGVEALHQAEPPASWHAFARAHFKDRAKGQASARILLTEDVETAESASVSRLELIEL